MPEPIRIDLRNLPALTNNVYYPLYADKSRYLVMKGGGSSGKSVFAAQKIIFRMLSDKPKKKKHRILVVRKVKADLRDSCFEELKGVIAVWGLSELFYVPQGRSSDLYIRCNLNGNEIIFYGLDDVERRKSIHGITGMWIEEASELEASDFRQLDIRMRGSTESYKQIILTFNPISIAHWLKNEFFDSRKPSATVVETTYKDNRFLDGQSISVLEDFRNTDEYYYAVYCLGQWGVIGKTVYPAQIVTERLAQLMATNPLRTGVFIYRGQADSPEQIDDNTIDFIEDGTGPVRIYEEPQSGYPYIIGADIAEGGIDYSAASVRNNSTWQQAAVYQGHSDTDEFAKQMYCLGTYYNRALIGIETNFDLHPVKELQRLGYSDQYVRESLDKYTGETVKKFGFQTTKITRPIIIAKHTAMAKEHIDTWHDRASVEEMLTFVRDAAGRPSAQSGKHDDLIFADAICLEIRQQGRFSVQVPPRELSPLAREKEERAQSAAKRRKNRALLS